LAIRSVVGTSPCRPVSTPINEIWSPTRTAAAEDYFQQALDWARRQKALSWELRAATSLAKLWHQDDKTSEVEKLLSAVYGQFIEGFDTIDLRTAAALLNEFRA
jgi:predicted ATPase